jgi:hypothetical protein
MQVGYICMAQRRPAVWKRIAVLLALIAAPVSLKWERVSAAAPNPTSGAKTHLSTLVYQQAAVDPRVARLQRFLNSLHCPVSYLAEDFIHAADDNHLDWRLLPSISVIESGGGKAYKNNNIFGWANGDYLFPTLRSSIHEVAFKLGKSPLYRNRDVEGKLRLYNPDPSYAQNVMTVMGRISPIEDLRRSARLVREQNEFAYLSD